MLAGSAHFGRIRSVMTKVAGKRLSHAVPAAPALELVPAGLRPESAA
jgi:hypothetical protein